MATAVPSKRQVETNTPPPGKSLVGQIRAGLSSTVGQKYLVALTGAVLVGFVIVHMLGNLNVFRGRDALNNYAAFLKSNPAVLWSARAFLLVCFVVHVAVSLKLRYRSAQARPVAYTYKQVIQATLASRTMVLTGLVILAFLLFHLAHYTLGVVGTAEIQVGGHWQEVSLLDLREFPSAPADPAQNHHDVYAMTWVGFHNPVIAILYIVAQLLLILHMSHGVGSMFQTLGLNTPRVQPILKVLSWGVALVVGLGNIFIVVMVWASQVPPPPYPIR